MTHETRDCFCCGGALGSLFAANCEPARLAAWQVPPVSRRTVLAGAIAAAGAWPALALSQSPDNTTVFTGGTVLNVDRSFSQVEAIAIRANQIIAVGSDAMVRAAAGAGAKVVNLHGRVIRPGLEHLRSRRSADHRRELQQHADPALLRIGERRHREIRQQADRRTRSDSPDSLAHPQGRLLRRTWPQRQPRRTARHRVGRTAGRGRPTRSGGAVRVAFQSLQPGCCAALAAEKERNSVCGTRPSAQPDLMGRQQSGAGNLGPNELVGKLQFYH